MRPPLWLRNRYALWGGYAVFFLFCCLTSAYCTFPYDRVRDFIVQQVENPKGPDGVRQRSDYQLEIVELKPYWVTGVALTGVRVVKLPDSPVERPVDLTIDELSVHVSPLSYLFGTTSVSFDALIDTGEIDGSYSDSDEETVIEAELSELNLRRLTILRSLVGLPITGTATGAVDLTLAAEPANTQGTVELDIKGVQVGDGKAKLQLEGMSSGFTVERISIGDLVLRLSVQSGVAKIERFQTNGADAQVQAEGTIRLTKPLSNSTLDLVVRFKFTDAYRNRSDRTRALFSLLDFNPRVRAARTPDGWLQYRLRGSLGSRIVPTAAGGSSRRPGGF